MLDARAQNRRPPYPKSFFIKVASPVFRGNFYFFSRHSFILLDGNKPAATILTGAQVSFFLLATNPAGNIKIYLEAFSFTTVRQNLVGNLSPLFYNS